MTNFLVKTFVKDYQNIDDIAVHTRYGFFSGVIGIITNMVLIVAKLFIAIISSSMAIMADAINNLSDVLSSVVTLVGFKLSGKEADEDHPFGHARIEYISGLIISLAILVVGVNFITQSIGKIFNPEVVIFNEITIIVLSISILIKFWQAHFYKKISKIISSSTVYAASKDSFNDCLATSAVLVAVIFGCFFPDINIDAYAGILVSLMIIKSGIGLVFETTSPLIGSLPPLAKVNELIELATKSEKILGYHDLIVHSYGPRKMFATIHLEFDYRDDILMIHDIVDNIEGEILSKMGIQVVVHMDPIVIDDEETNELRGKVSEIISKISPEISFHDLRLVKGTTHTKVLFDVVIPINRGKDKSVIKNDISNRIKLINPKYETVITFDLRFLYRQ